MSAVSDSQSLHVDDTGETDLPAVVCLHSLFLDNHMFDDVVDAARGRFRMIRPEFRGQGRNPDATETVTMEQCADDVLQLLDDLGLERAHLVAQSMGGDVAVRVAARRPEAIERMVLLGSSARAEPADQLEAFRPIADEVERDGFVGEILETIVQIMFGESCRADPDRAAVVDAGRAHFAALPPGLAPAVRGVIERTDATPLLAGIPAQSLVIAGTEDIARPVDWSRQVVDELPNASLWVLEATGHSVILEQPDLVTGPVLDFLESGTVPSAATA